MVYTPCVCSKTQQCVSKKQNKTETKIKPCTWPTGLKLEGGEDGMSRWGKVNDEVSRVEMLKARTVRGTLGRVYKHQPQLWAVR